MKKWGYISIISGIIIAIGTIISMAIKTKSTWKWTGRESLYDVPLLGLSIGYLACDYFPKTKAGNREYHYFSTKDQFWTELQRRSTKEKERFEVANISYIQFDYYTGSGMFPDPEIQVVNWRWEVHDNIISTPAKNISLVAKVPELGEVSFTKDIYTEELPFRTTGKNTHIVTLKSRITLKWDAKTRRLAVHSETLPVSMALPNAEQRLKDKPNFDSKPEDVEIFSPDYITLKNYKTIDEIPIEIIVKEIRGSVEWM